MDRWCHARKARAPAGIARRGRIADESRRALRAADDESAAPRRSRRYVARGAIRLRAACRQRLHDLRSLPGGKIRPAGNLVERAIAAGATLRRGIEDTDLHTRRFDRVCVHLSVHSIPITSAGIVRISAAAIVIGLARSLPDLISRMRCGQKAWLQGARSAVRSFQINDEQRGRRAFWPQPEGRASLWAQGGVATALIVARTTARSRALPCTQIEARAYVKSSPTGS